ncbi:MAG: WD40 repeat domain-containing protein [Candidatus Babeliales bacterium]
MFNYFFFFCSILCTTTNLWCMRTQPFFKVVTTNDGKEYMAHPKLFAACNSVVPIDPTEHIFPLKTVSSTEWEPFEACLQALFKEERTMQPAQQRSLGVIIGEQATNKKRARDILAVAHLFGHDQLVDATMQLWADRNYGMPEQISSDSLPHELVYDLPADAQEGIAQKVLYSTPLDQKLPKWVIKMNIKPRTIKLTQSLWSCAANKHSQVAVGCVDGTITILADETVQRNFPAHTKEVSDLHFCPDGNFLFSAAQDSVIKVWNAQQEFAFVREFQLNKPTLPFSIALNTQNTLIATPLDQGIRVFDANTDDINFILNPNSKSATVIFDQTGARLIADAQQSTIAIFNVQTGIQEAALEIQQNIPQRLQCNAQNSLLAAGMKSGLIFLWNLSDFSLQATFNAHANKIWAIEFSPCSRFLFTASTDKTVKIWDLVTVKCIKTFNVNTAVHDMRLTPDLELIIACKNRALKFIPIKDFLKQYQKHCHYFKNKTTLAQALLIQEAFTRKQDNPLVLTPEARATLSTFDPIIKALLQKELPFQKATKKKRKTEDEKDADYVPDN